MNTGFYKLMLVTQREHTPLLEYLHFIKKCIDAGVTCVQLREKNADLAFKLQFAQQLKLLLTPCNVPLIINDDLDLAMLVDAEGVHLGQSDGSPQRAREQLGTNKFIGLSIESEDELKQADLLDLSYVAASAVFPTPNKKNLKTIWGIDGVNKLCQQTRHPLIGIGGINEYNLQQLMQAGAEGAAVIGALHGTHDPGGMTARLRKIIDTRNP